LKAKRILAHVTWIDPQSHVGWFDLEAVLEMKAAVVHSVGLLVRESKGYIALSTSICENGDIADPLIIPKKLIVKMKKEVIK
jgi:hypothetical protein